MHVIQPGRLELSKWTTTAVRELKDDTTQTDLRSFRNLCSALHRFIPNGSNVTVSLNKVLQKERPRTFPFRTKSKKDAVDNLKTLQTNPPILAHPRKVGQYTVDTDACDSQVGCVLLKQHEDGTARPIRYWSRTLTGIEQKLETTHEKRLAVMWALLLLRPYLGLDRLNIRTDHEALKRLMTSADASGKLARW